MNKQLSLPIECESVYSEANFVITSCNVSAFNWLKLWPYRNSNNFTCIIGNKSSGKTHLSHIWADDNKATYVHSSNFDIHDFCNMIIENNISKFVIDDFDCIADDILMFHLYNLVKNNGCFALMTSSVAPSLLNIQLPDTRSRLATIHTERITDPCDVIEMVISKMLQNRGITPKSNIITYIANHIERSYCAINTLMTLIEDRLPEYGKFSIDFIKNLTQKKT